MKDDFVLPPDTENIANQGSLPLKEYVIGI
jgi:hypothetical protein